MLLVKHSLWHDMNFDSRWTMPPKLTTTQTYYKPCVGVCVFWWGCSTKTHLPFASKGASSKHTHRKFLEEPQPNHATKYHQKFNMHRSTCKIENAGIHPHELTYLANTRKNRRAGQVDHSSTVGPPGFEPPTSFEFIGPLIYHYLPRQRGGVLVVRKWLPCRGQERELSYMSICLIHLTYRLGPPHRFVAYLS